MTKLYMLNAVVCLLGFVFVSIGCYKLHPPVAFIVGGVILIIGTTINHERTDKASES